MKIRGFLGGLGAALLLAPAAWGAISVSALVVGGGGGGGDNWGAGGGAGDVEVNASLNLTAASYTVTTGGGGGGSTTSGAAGSKGSSSSFASLTATGGGGGGANNGNNGSAGTSGGSGGGGGGANSGFTAGAPGATGAGSNVFAGGAGHVGTTTSGGGGGASAAGGAASASAGGNGGNGYTSTISGSSATYAGGGAGGGYAPSAVAAGTPGTGGGGTGATVSGSSGGAGTANTGGGGGGGAGASGKGGAGASGVVIISYPSSLAGLATGSTGTFTQTSSGGDTIYTFTGNGSFVPPAAYTPTPTPAATATPACSNVVVRVACGQASSYTDSGGNVWSADYGYSGGSTASTGTGIAGTVDDSLYQHNRWATPLTYTFSVANGTYQVVLLEAETYHTAAGQRVFNIAINGTTVKTNYDIFAAAGGENIATSLTFTTTVSTGSLAIVGTASVDNAQFCAIQITKIVACTSPTATPTTAGGGPPTSTVTPTGTQTTTPLPTVYQGLPVNMEPYGMEYVPFPTVTTSGANASQFYPLYMTFSAAGPTTNNLIANTKWGAPCNTARWHIVFQGLSSTVGAVANANPNDLTIAVETRIGNEGITCDTGVYDANYYSTATSLTLPNTPSDNSTSYFWVGVTSTVVPYTERFDALGDPRYEPYADELDYTGAANDGLNGGYNWFWRNFASGEASGTYRDQVQDSFYANFIPSASVSSAMNDEYGGPSSGTNQGDDNIDVPKLFKLIRTGIMVSNDIYTAMNGWDSFYAGEGGEIGGDNANDFANGPPIEGGPWGSTTDPYNVDEIKGVGSGSANVNGACYVVTGTSSTNIGWMSLPFVGELWPDGLYASNWESNTTYNSNNTTWGNLINLQSKGSTGTAGTALAGVAYRANLQNIPSTASPYYLTVYHRTNGIGCSSMLNGTNDGTTQFNHTGGTEAAAPVDNDGVQASLDYNISLPATFAVARTWSLTLGNSAPEWSDQPYLGTRTHLDTYSACTYTTDPSTAPNGWGFYASENYPASSVYKNSAAIRVIDLNNALSSQSLSGNPAGGWFVVNALAPSTQTGINFVAQFAILACLRTLADAGVPTMAAATSAPTFTTNNHNTYNGSGAASGQTYRIPPVPLVTIAHPNNSDQVKGQTTISVQWDVRYARWDGNEYDENYPCIDANVGPCSSSNLIPNPALEWHDTQPIAFNIIYNEPASVSPTAWYSALTGSIVPAGYFNNYVVGGAGNYISGTADSILPGGPYQTSPYQFTYPWTNVASANYKLQVECFRLPSASSPVAYPNYGYHQIIVDTVP